MTIPADIFREYDIRGIVGKDLSAEVAHAVGRAFAAYLDDAGVSGSVALGRDNRPSGGELHGAIARGLQESGRDVVDIGVGPTPIMYWGLHHLPVAAGLQVTGSHNPPEYNGFKLSIGSSSLHGSAIQRLYSLTQERPRKSVRQGALSTATLSERYIEDIVARVGPLRRRPRVVFNAGNGAAALVVESLFERLGVNGDYLFCESDGTFPNHHPDPTVPKNLEALIQRVREVKADLGVAFDGDGDRIGVVDDTGEIIWGDYLLILYARDALARTGVGQPIIFDVKCSEALPQAITAAGGRPVMWKTGHSLIKDKMKEEHAPVAGEMSGHMFFAEGFYGHDDAVYGAARLLGILDRGGLTLRTALADVPRFVSTPELRVDCAEAIKFEVVKRAVAYFSARYDVIDVDGVRIRFPDGWGLIRASNTQPVLVLRFEASSAERLAANRREVEQWLATQGITL